MNNDFIACFYYPTTVALIDDDQAFLSNMRLNLANSFPIILYQGPKEALHDLIDNEKLLFSGNELLIVKQGYSLSHDDARSSLISINIREIHTQIYNPKRFQDITTIIVDYDMPIMDGVKFCQLLKDQPVRKLMLTGKAGNDTAVTAFNNKLIDKFLLKGSEDIVGTMIDTIEQEQAAYFHSKSKVIQDIIIKENTSLLHTNEFFQLFYNLFKQSKACEYYILDTSGSFLLLDKDANLTFLLVKSDTELENYYQIAKDSDSPQNILSDLENREKLLFLLTEEDEKLSPHEWVQYLYPANKIANSNYYYSIVTGAIKGIHQQKILSYRTFLKSM